MRKIFVAVPTTGNVVDSQTYRLRELAERYKEHVEFVYPKLCVRRTFHDFARNELVREFLATDCEALWFLDSDITPPKHVLDFVALYWDRWEVAGAPYPVFMAPQPGEPLQCVFTVYKASPTGGLRPGRIPSEGIEYVDGIATGCMFIKRSVFEHLEEPYFEFKYRPENKEIVEGEDLGFCLKLKSLGIQFLTDYSMVCNHRKTVDLLEVNNYAIQYANNQVRAYDLVAKEELSRLKADLVKKREASKRPNIIIPSTVGPVALRQR